MKAIICLDDHNGMRFNNRRQSRDAAVIDHIRSITQGQKLWISPDSQKLFSEEDAVCIDENYLEKAADNDWCFIEDSNIMRVMPKVHTLVVYRWNRHYPADTYFLYALQAPAEKCDFPGNSHPIITREVYKL